MFGLLETVYVLILSSRNRVDIFEKKSKIILPNNTKKNYLKGLIPLDGGPITWFYRLLFLLLMHYVIR